MPDVSQKAHRSHAFCTYFDANYLPRGLALYESLRRHCPDAHLLALCMDSESVDILARLDLDGLVVIPLQSLEEFDPELASVRCTRTRIEYYFTCSPCLPRYILAHYGDIPLITYLDADLFFFSSPEPLFDEMRAASIGIIEHGGIRGSEADRYGWFNVGWISFRRDGPGLECLGWWRKRCIEWCYDRVEHGRFADQKYLDEWPTRFPNVHIIRHRGANVAPWNLKERPITCVGRTVFADGTPLIFYHFHGLKRLKRRMFDTGLREYGVSVERAIRNGVYQPYLSALLRAERLIAGVGGGRGGATLRGGSGPKKARSVGGLIWYARWLARRLCEHQVLMALSRRDEQR